ncbi:MAG TPA: hypothetical protein VN817_07885 [Solirubrobacteraceae bacterium]|nr:hypothetical protein [Solirubrobacteraceae bacterium]
MTIFVTLACVYLTLAFNAGSAAGHAAQARSHALHAAAHQTVKRSCRHAKASAGHAAKKRKCANAKKNRRRGKARAPVSGGKTGSGKAGAPTSPALGKELGSTATGLVTEGPLKWAPPALSSPKIVSVPSGQDPYVLNLNTGQDYIVSLPTTGLHGTLEINGGHNVVLTGGEIIVPSSANQSDNGADGSDTALYVRGSTGVVHLEGLLLRGEANVQFDGIDVNAPEAVVQVENVRMSELYGSQTTEHADAIQTWGGAKALDIDRLTADGDYQGLTINPNNGNSVASSDIENVNLTVDPRPAALAESSVGGGIMLWLTTETSTCNTRPVKLSNVYIDNESGRVPSTETVWPSPTSGLPCAAVISGGRASWPGLPVSGSVSLSAPPAGSFVPAGVAGLSYLSPGYLGS